MKNLAPLVLPCWDVLVNQQVLPSVLSHGAFGSADPVRSRWWSDLSLILLLLYLPSYGPWCSFSIFLTFICRKNYQFKECSVQFSHSVVSDFLRPHGLQHARPPCLLPTPGVQSNSCPLSQWCHPTISSSVIFFFSCLQSFPVSESYPMSWHFASGGHSIGASASASVLPMSIQDWLHLELTGWISLLSKGLSRVFSNTTVQKRQFFSTHLSYSPPLTSIHDCWKNHSFD